MKYYSGIEYLKIDIANQYGKKGTFKQRINWVNSCNNLEERVLEAKHPARYLAAIQALHDTEEGKATGHLVGLDASASGCQMMAVVMRCETTAKNTGIIGKRPKDLYQITTTKMSEILGETVNIDRALVKDAQMPFFYGSKARPKQLFGIDTPEYKAFHKAQIHVAPGAVDMMHIVQACWQPYADEHSWVMPDGFQVRVPVEQTETLQIHIPELDTDIIHKTSVVRGTEKGVSLAANITHSIDAYVMRSVVKLCKDFEMLVIHDEFLAHANNMNQVREAYVKVLADISESDLLDDILTQITGKEVIIDKSKKSIKSAILASEYAIH